MHTGGKEWERERREGKRGSEGEGKKKRHLGCKV
jgi:hypothetical protein